MRLDSFLKLDAIIGHLGAEAIFQEMIKKFWFPKILEFIKKQLHNAKYVEWLAVMKDCTLLKKFTR